jgi:hypothetical protein
MNCNECKKFKEPCGCTVYSEGGVAFRIRMDSCPFNPKKVESLTKKQRVGQQKQAKRGKK